MRMMAVLAGASALALALGEVPAAADELRDAVAAQMPELNALYRDLHANPELSLQEVETAKKLAARARALGFKVTEGVGKTGVVAVMENGPGPVVMFRGDMDGLPVREATGLPWASKATAPTEGGGFVPLMHACGHDAHVTFLIGVAKVSVVAIRLSSRFTRPSPPSHSSVPARPPCRPVRGCDRGGG